MPGEPRRPPYSAVVLVLMALVIGCYYHWAVRAAGYDIRWERNGNGYYNYLARGFAGGHLFLPVEPAPQLLAQPNPWDPRVDGSLKLFDAVLYKRHYYLYHGPGPALMLFVPWRLLTGRDMPENFALFVFCFGGYLFACGALLGALKIAGVTASPPVLATIFLALGTCQAVPFLLNRVWVYEIAIGGGYFCLSAASFFLVRSLLSYRRIWLTASGLMFGLAVSCRPHLLIAAALAVPMVGFTLRRLAAFGIPLMLIGAAIATYNFARFGNPLEFGNRYLLGGENQTEVHLSAANIAPGMYYLLLSPPELSPVFPWVRMPVSPRAFAHPAIYTVEPTTGALFLAPFLPGILFGFFTSRIRGLICSLAASGFLVLLFLAGTGWVTQRYAVDFLPLLVLATLIGLARSIGRFPWVRRTLVITVVIGLVTNLALGLAGPYNEMLKNRPARFVAIARWFSPIAKYRPVRNPAIHETVRTAVVPKRIFAAGAPPYRYELWIENGRDAPRLVSRFGDDTVMRDLSPTDGTVDFQIDYLPDRGVMRIARQGVTWIEHPIGPLVSAPSQILTSQ